MTDVFLREYTVRCSINAVKMLAFGGAFLTLSSIRKSYGGPFSGSRCRDLSKPRFQHNRARRGEEPSQQCPEPSPVFPNSTIRLLEPRPSTLTTKLLGLASPAVSHQQCAVVLYQGLLQLVLGVLINEFLVVCDDALCDRLTDGVDLGCVTTAGNADADVYDGEFVEADDEDGFVDLRSCQ
jgi:hypothetical protein